MKRKRGTTWTKVTEGRKGGVLDLMLCKSSDDLKGVAVD